MHIAITILLACLIIVLALVLIILLVPLRYKLDLNFNQPVPQFNFSLRNCCYGLQISRQEKQLIVQLILFGFRRPLKQPPPANKSVRPASDRKASFSPRLLKEIVLDSAWKKHIGGLVQGIWHIIHPHRMLIRARIGFTEPHYTGWLIALAGILQAMNHAYNIQLEGVWDEPCFAGELILAGRLILIQLLWQLLKFILKPEIRSAYKRIRTQKNPSSQQQAA